MTGMDRSDPGPRVAAHQREGRGVTRIGYPIGVRRARVVRREAVTPRMLRLTLAGDELADFVTHAADDHVKIVFPLPDGTRNDPVPDDHDELDWPRPHTPTRKYTVRRYDAGARELDLDFVVHEGGLAAEWAAAVEVGVATGEEAVVAGPPGAKAFAHTYGHYVLAVDVTALPAVARWLDELGAWASTGVTAQVLVDHDHADETSYPLAVRPGVDVRWLSRTGGSRLAEETAALPLPDDPREVFVFAAGEAGDIKPLRRWAAEKGYDALVTGYWKRGVAGHEE